MRNRVSNAVIAVAMATALGAALAAQGGPPGGGQGAGGGRGGFNLPPLLMETNAFPDGGIVPPKYVSAGGGASVLPGFKISNAPAGRFHQ